MTSVEPKGTAVMSRDLLKRTDSVGHNEDCVDLYHRTPEEHDNIVPLGNYPILLWSAGIFL